MDRKRALRIAEGGALRAVPVQVGPSDGKSTAIVGGELAEGDRVAVGAAGSSSAAPAASSGAGQRRPPFRSFP